MAEATLTVLSHSRRQRLQHLLRQVDEHLVELAPAQQVEVLDDLQGAHARTHVSTHALGHVRAHTRTHARRGAGRHLELLQETRLLHHQRPQVLRDTNTENLSQCRGGRGRGGESGGGRSGRGSERGDGGGWRRM